MSDTQEDKNLIQKYLKGDERSLELLVSKYLKMIYTNMVSKALFHILRLKDPSRSQKTRLL